MYKIAGASEVDPTFTYSVSETCNIRLVAIQDVNTSDPFPDIWSGLNELNVDSFQAINGTTNMLAQSVHGDGAELAGCAFWLRKVGSPAGTITATLRGISGTMGTTATGASTTVWATATMNAADLSTTAGWAIFTFGSAYTTALNVDYVLRIEYTGNASDYIEVGVDTTAPTHPGNYSAYTTAWNYDTSKDICCLLRNTKGYYTQNITSISQIPALDVASTVDNSLVLYICVTSTAAVPAFLEGPVTLEEGSDGSSHSDGLSWGFLSTANRANTQLVWFESAVAATGLIMGLVIAPPATGATVIPAFCANDLCDYIDPLNGTSAYDGNAAFTANATTYFSTSLNGMTLSNGTAAAASDVGLNSFHSMSQLTGSTTNGVWTGATLVPSAVNRPNVTDKNILVHLKPSTPRVLQTTDSIAKAGVKGIAFGMASAANSDYRVWHVHGAGTLWDSAQHLPVVIHPDAITGRIQNTGTLSATAIVAFGFMVSGRTVAPIWQFGSLWMLDVTTVAGGNAAHPVDLNGINKVCSTGKERISVLVQGSGQSLLLQPIQFGNGGADPIYLKLEETAIEFPAQYNLDAKNVFYNSVDNAVGLTYYAGASDTIKHISSQISSENAYYWDIHASSSASASYDFTGLTIINAGRITLRNVTTFSSISFSNCTAITQNSAPIESSSFADCLLASDNPAVLADNSFTSNSTGHAIEILTVGTYSFKGNTFSGYATSNGSTGNEAIYNNSGGNVILNISGGGGTPSVCNGSGATTTVNNTVSISFTGLIDNTEVRIYRDSDGAELYGLENSSTGTVTYSYNYTTDTVVTATIFNTLYEPIRLQLTLGNTSNSIPIQQRKDRWYSNP
jgi:hypothetical protein